jgi:nucleoside-diphosphate-sugar epimerase
MRMSHIYQPLLIRALVDAGGVATLRQLAQAFLVQDESQLQYYEKRIKEMPVPVLSRHGVVERDGQLVVLNTKALTVVVHPAFIIMGDLEESRKVNLQGSRNVFESAIASRKVKRLVYTSSVSAYGFHRDNPTPLTEDVEPRGTDRFYYSAQKAELEVTLAGLLKGKSTAAYVFRPCIVSGPDALLHRREGSRPAALVVVRRRARGLRASIVAPSGPCSNRTTSRCGQRSGSTWEPSGTSCFATAPFRATDRETHTS